jgi:DNA-directed RNA polymerase subunit RPC12/RpoP
MYEQDPGAKFCSSCGGELIESPPKQVCPEYINLVRHNATFCPYCGFKFKEEVPA